MTLPKLKDRATVLRAELDRRFAPGNKRSLTHCETMDVLAACDGARSRQAAQAAEREAPCPDPVAEETPESPVVPLRDREDWKTPVIPFADASGYLGADTNGARPEAVDGLFLEGQIEPYRYRGEAGRVLQSFWLKATRPGASEDHVLFFSDVAEAERFLTAVLECQMRLRDQVQMDGMSAYRNTAQLQHDEDASEECEDDQRALVSARPSGFVAVVGQPHRNSGQIAGKPVASLRGDLGAAGARALSIALRDLVDWAEQRVPQCARDLERTAPRNPLPRHETENADTIRAEDARQGDLVDLQEAIRIRHQVATAEATYHALQLEYAEVASTRVEGGEVELTLVDLGAVTLKAGTRIHRKR